MVALYKHVQNITIIRDEDSQLERMMLQGLSTHDTNGTQNVDSEGLLHLTISKSGSTVTVSLYKDEDLAAADLVARGSIAADTGTVTLATENDSRLSGSVRVEYVKDIDNIKVRPFYTLDTDLRFYEKTLEEWLPYPDRETHPAAFGFAAAHAKAKWETEKFLRETRSAELPRLDTETNLFHYQGQMFDPFFFGLYGDLTQRVPDFQFIINRDQLVEVVCWKVLHYISWHNKNKNPEEDQWADLAIYYDKEWKGKLRGLDLDFDLNFDGRINFVSQVADNRLERA